jgi:hypothetical protein
VNINNMPENKNDERLVPRALDGLEYTESFVSAKPIDRRVRSTAGDFRVVAPDGTQKGSKFYVNNSPVVIERRGKDAMGAEKWDRITSYPKPGLKTDSTEIDFALYWLLAGPDAE